MATTPPPPGSNQPANLKIPKGKIKTGKYTSGGEYIVESTNVPYKGYYYLFNHTAYVGKEYDPNSLKLFNVVLILLKSVPHPSIAVNRLFAKPI